MKYRPLQLFIILVLITGSLKAQNLIAVQNEGNVSLFTQVTAAVEAAINGDTIYIPGGSWPIDHIYIDKALHIIGVGHNPDSAHASGYTYLTGYIHLLPGCSYGSLTGLYLNGQIITSLFTDTIENFSLLRCRFTQNVSLPANLTNSWFVENIFEAKVGGCDQPGPNNCWFYNNFFAQNIYPFSIGNCFKNNLFTNPSLVGAINCLFENNIFLWGECLHYISCTSYWCTLNNNLFVINGTFPPGNGNVGFNNIVNQPQESIFINQSGSTYSYSQDYQLKPTCPGKNAGTDGTDIGIYGGMFPWKDGSLPPNPHIQQKIIQQTTDQNGNLNVNIKVAAQDH